MLYDENKHTKKQLIAIYLMAGIPLFFGFYMAIWGFGQIADKKAQNPDNLIRGCMYYDGYRKDKHRNISFYFLIEDKIAIQTDLFRGNFFLNLEKFSYSNREDFYDYIIKNQKSCFLVSYIKLDFILFKKVFVYEYHGEKPNLPTNLSQ